MKKNNFEIIDLFKFIFSLVVIGIHTTSLNISQNFYISNLWNSISILAVPFFFISTGYLSFYNSEEIQIDKVKKMLLKFVKIYLIWTIIYLPITICYFYISNYSLQSAIIYFIRSFVFIGENYNSWPLWYLLASIYGFLLLYIFLKLKISNKKIYILSIILLLFGFSITILNNFCFSNILFRLFGGSGRLLYGIGYISIGIYLSISKKNIKHSNKLSILFFLLLIITPKEYKIVSALFFNFFAFQSLLKVKLKTKKIDYLLLRTMSTVSYFMHMIVYTFVELIVNNFEYRGFVPFIICVLITWIFGIGYYYRK